MQQPIGVRVNPAVVGAQRRMPGPHRGFPFIYPPFAAVLFAPMAAVPQRGLQIGWSAFNLLLLSW